MLDKRRLTTQPDEKREELFTRRYQDLLGWALRLTHQQRESAEDLVQDAFVQFMLGRTRLEEIENIDGYLRRMLRYMHFSRTSRAAQHLHDTTLSVADYDSLRLSWTAIEPQRRMQAVEELRQICAYACSRKESSRAGSVLILRFFHDYFPTEIASILNSSRHCVDQWQRLARQELKLFIDEPSRLRFVAFKSSAELSHIKYSGSDCDLMADLRRIIFSSCQGECISPDRLREVYNSQNGDALTTATLAHIVSCPECLDAVNLLLDLPALATRYQTGPCEKQEPPTDGTGGGVSGGGTSGETTKLKRRLREVVEHKPHELRIAVNGALVSSLKVTSDVTEFDLNLPSENRIQFIEVFSEQGIQLLFLSVDNALGSEPEQWASVELSEARRLQAYLSLQTGPSLRVVYQDPAYATSYNTEAHPNTSSSPLAIVQPPGQPTAVATRIHETLPSWTGRLLSLFKIRRWIRPQVVTALFAIAIVAAFLLYKTSLTPTLTGTTLLAQARAVEQRTSGIPDLVSHRSVNLEERRSTQGAVVSRRKIEIWENHERGDRALRLYDENNRLVAGSLQKANGARTIYHHGLQPRTQAPGAISDSLLLNSYDIWQLEPSAKVFIALIGETAATDMVENATSYVISFEGVRLIGTSRLLKASLTLGKDLHPIEQTLIIEVDGALREYRFVEASFERLPTKNVAPAVFEVEPELTGGDGASGARNKTTRHELTSTRTPPFVVNSSANASAELEVDVAFLLNQAKADRNEQISLSRTENGLLLVEGIVDNQERKDTLLNALAPLRHNPAVRIEIRTVAEATNASRQQRSVTLLETQDTADTVAVDGDLRNYFSQGNKAAFSTDAMDETVRTFSSRMVNRSYRALFHSIELKRLVNRFANVDMRTVTPDARAKWIEMLHQHGTGFAREGAQLREELQPVFFAGASSSVGNDNYISNDVELARAVERLHSLAQSINQAIRSSFTISSQSSSAVKSSQFWRWLIEAEKLATQIKQYDG